MQQILMLICTAAAFRSLWYGWKCDCKVLLVATADRDGKFKKISSGSGNIILNPKP